MNFFRTDGQAALNALFVAAQETLHQYRDAVALVEPDLGQVLGSISKQRHGFIRRLEDAVRASGDLPTASDPDKEAGEMLFHHVAALIKTDYADEILEQRLEADKKLAELVIDARNTELVIDAPNKELEAQYTLLLDDLTLHISETIVQLQPLHARAIAQQE